MDRTTGANWIDIGGGRRGFKDENAVAGVTGTEVQAAHLNAVQEEILNVIEQSGQVPDSADWTQLWQALQSLITNHINIPQTSAFTDLSALADMPVINTDYVAQSLTISGTRYIDAYSSVGFYNKDPVNGVCNCLTWIRLNGVAPIGHVGCIVAYPTHIPCNYRRLYTGLDPAQSYTVDLMVKKITAVSPIEVDNALLVLIHE